MSINIDIIIFLCVFLIWYYNFIQTKYTNTQIFTGFSTNENNPKRFKSFSKKKSKRKTHLWSVSVSACAVAQSVLVCYAHCFAILARLSFDLSTRRWKNRKSFFCLFFFFIIMKVYPKSFTFVCRPVHTKIEAICIYKERYAFHIPTYIIATSTRKNIYKIWDSRR